MSLYEADLDWQSKIETTLDFINTTSQKIVTFEGLVVDLYLENELPYAVIYDYGTMDNSFITYVQLHYDQLSILKKQPKASGYFAVRIRNVIPEKPYLSLDSDGHPLIYKKIIKSEGDMVGFYLKNQ
jgi:hypothetical protein